jgi:hypothetical protein
MMFREFREIFHEKCFLFRLKISVKQGFSIGIVYRIFLCFWVGIQYPTPTKEEPGIKYLVFFQKTRYLLSVSYKQGTGTGIKYLPLIIKAQVSRIRYLQTKYRYQYQVSF